MPTKFYFHDATTTVGGTLPGATVITGGTTSVTAAGASTNRTMDENVGSSQVSQALTTSASTSAIINWFRRFISPPLAAQTFATQTVTVSIGASEANTASDMFETGSIGLSIWRPSSGTEPFTTNFGGAAVGVALTEPGTSQTACSGSATMTVTGSPVSIQAGDVIVVELRDSKAQSMASAYTNTIFYDGTTEGSATNIAAYIEFTNDVALETGPATHNLAGDITLDPALDGAVGRDTFASGDITFNPAVDGVLGRETKLAGDMALDIAVDGNIAIEAPAHALVGDITFDPAIDGAVGRQTSLAGDVTFDPALDGAVGRTTSLTGDIAYNPAVDGIVTRTTFLVGDIAQGFEVDGNIAVTSGATEHSLSGDITFNPVVDGVVARTTFATGDITFEPALDGAIGRTTSVAGDIAYTINLDGALSRQTSLAGDIVLTINLDGNIAFAATVVPATVRAADIHPRAASAVDTDVSEQAARDMSGVLVAARDLTP